MARFNMGKFLRDRGFDRSRYAAGFPGRWIIGCSQCMAQCINGKATHEAGCPNSTHRCKGCDAIIPVRKKYCEACDS